jgi:dihydrofolate reductase
MIAAIWAQTRDGVIGRNNSIPWHYPGDFRRFKRMTMGAAVVMGRNTFTSIGKLLPGRMNVVIASSPKYLSAPGLLPPETCLIHAFDVRGALYAARSFGHEGDVWFIGGARVYVEAMPLIEAIDVTYVPDVIPVEGSVLAPTIAEAFVPCPETNHPEEPGLRCRQFWRKEEPYKDASNRRLQELGILSRRR